MAQADRSRGQTRGTTVSKSNLNDPVHVSKETDALSNNTTDKDLDSPHRYLDRVTTYKDSKDKH